MSQIKLITYQRVLNLGNYESKRLELQAEVMEGEDPEEAVYRLMEQVERQIREPQEDQIIKNIRQLQKEVKQLQSEKNLLEQTCKSLSKTPEPSPDEEEPDPDPDDIPFEGAGAATSSDLADY
ncbi:hypothetical protein [Cylindrospermum sp. FACHB-282]|uniref:hypothetical protein n=1 Tax=Cylindrospermum sp. FACHB-282 TaxID=2692794 RepID=UPI0016878F32|nr:hypothetical protein [Cylindrospermum sp. FACHB-282]MBD2388819.1 hypothetical protein [Cylindrospermum sp. FACHB-282]